MRLFRTADPVSLEQMLEARERRAAMQRRMLKDGVPGAKPGNCLVCLTLNIAGEIKRTPMTRMLFDHGVTEFESSGFRIRDSFFIDEATGSEAFWLLDEDAARVKTVLEGIEDSFPAARLYDFDVIMPGGGKLSRACGRRCLICDAAAAECARSRRHGLQQIRDATDELLKDFCAGILAEDAYGALLDELQTTPKPGLVDMAGNGAHTDMDAAVFERSAAALRPYFKDAARMGMEKCGIESLRERGMQAEEEMFAATGGVNTHKGLIYSMGLLLAGMGRSLAERGDLAAGRGSAAGRSTAEGMIFAERGRFANDRTPDSANDNRNPESANDGILTDDTNQKSANDRNPDSANDDRNPESANDRNPDSANDNRNPESANDGILTDDRCSAYVWMCINYAAALAREDAEARLINNSTGKAVTNGGAAYKNYGAKGAVGEAAAGFPHALYCLSRLSYYRENGFGENVRDEKSHDTKDSCKKSCNAKDRGEMSSDAKDRGERSCGTKTFNEPAALALCDCMTVLEDTNLLHRGGREGLDYVMNEAARIAAMPETERIGALYELDSKLISRCLSPGGSADMLALALLLDHWQHRCVGTGPPAG